VQTLADEVNKLFGAGISKSQIAKRLGIGRTSVRRLIQADGTER
jgi:DNA-binding transcriptional regulator LsrR (DeoR family)